MVVREVNKGHCVENLHFLEQTKAWPQKKLEGQGQDSFFRRSIVRKRYENTNPQMVLAARLLIRR